MTSSPSHGAGSAARQSSTAAVAETDTQRHVNGRRRRLLMVARDFPPASTSAALRALKFTRHLSECSWDVSVVTARAGFSRRMDPALLRDVPPGCRVHSAYGFDTKAVLSIRNRYLRLLATPDRDVSWLPHGILSSLRAWRTEQPDALLSTSPPVTAHCIGLAVKRITKLPWVVELRDAWNLDVPSGPLSRRFDRRLERHILLAAARIVVTTDGLAADLEQRLGPRVGRKVAVVHNGYDEEAFARVPPRPVSSAPFRIAHTGQCTPPERDPVPFLQAVRRCLDRGELPADIEVLFVGAGPSFTTQLADQLRRLRLESNVRSTRPLPHAEALQAMLDASVLLVLQNRDAHRHAIPAKAYEYLRSGACMLVIAPPLSATAELLSRFPGVVQATPTDAEQIAQRLAEAYRRWKEAAGELRFARCIDAYSSRQLAVNLARLLDELVTTRDAERSGAS